MTRRQKRKIVIIVILLYFFWRSVGLYFAYFNATKRLDFNFDVQTEDLLPAPTVSVLVQRARGRADDSPDRCRCCGRRGLRHRLAACETVYVFDA